MNIINKTPYDLSYLKGKQIYPENFEWEANCYYIVEVAFADNNPIHRKIFFSGFLNYGFPETYNEFLLTSSKLKFSDAYFLKVIRKIDINE